MARNKVEGDQAVLITGCDRGFGRALAVRCVALGFKTYAACLTKEGAEELKAEVSDRGKGQVSESDRMWLGG
jgi:NAD(P)-dependent dehydrogenase (short-subunit alcohol dehydrogenase family)